MPYTKTDVSIGAAKGTLFMPAWELAHDAGKNDPAALYSKSPWAKTCVDLRANALAAIPWGIFDANDEEIEDHPVITLLTDVDNEVNWNDLIRATESDMLIFGSAYWLKVYGQGADGSSTTREPVNIRRLNPGTMEVVASKDGIAGFTQTIEGVPAPFAREEIVYFHDFDPANDMGGVSPTAVAADAIDLEHYADRYVTAFFRNSAAPGVVYTADQEMSDEDYSRIQRWIRKMRGVDNAHKTTILEKGLKPTVITFPLNQLALDTVRLEARRSICAAYGVPLSMAGADPSANFATMDGERKSLYTEHVIPRSEYLAGVINAELVKDFDDTSTFEWKVDELAIMQPDTNAERTSIALLVEKGVITATVGAVELGFSEEDVPGFGVEPTPPVVPGMPADPNAPPPFDPSAPQPGVTPPALQPYVDATVGQAEVPQKAIDADLKRWQRKSLARLKAGKPCAIDFESDVIPASLKAAIMGQLEGCEIADEVRNVFNARMDKPEPVVMPPSITVNVAAPTVNNIMPTQEPPTVKVDGSVINMPAPETTINFTPPEPPTPIVNVNVEAPEAVKATQLPPKMVGRTESQTVKRDAQGNIVTTDGIVEYHYEGE